MRNYRLKISFKDHANFNCTIYYEIEGVSIYKYALDVCKENILEVTHSQSLTSVLFKTTINYF